MGGRSREALGVDEGVVGETTSDDSDSSVNATFDASFWSVRDMSRPTDCIKGDGSGKLWVGDKLFDSGHTLGEREGILLGGKNCEELSRRIAEQIANAMRAGIINGAGKNRRVRVS